MYYDISDFLFCLRDDDTNRYTRSNFEKEGLEYVSGYLCHKLGMYVVNIYEEYFIFILKVRNVNYF
jgi:hypothetical protein